MVQITEGLKAVVITMAALMYNHARANVDNRGELTFLSFVVWEGKSLTKVAFVRLVMQIFLGRLIGHVF